MPPTHALNAAEMFGGQDADVKCSDLTFNHDVKTLSVSAASPWVAGTEASEGNGLTQKLKCKPS